MTWWERKGARSGRGDRGWKTITTGPASTFAGEVEIGPGHRYGGRAEVGEFPLDGASDRSRAGIERAGSGKQLSWHSSGNDQGVGPMSA